MTWDDGLLLAWAVGCFLILGVLGVAREKIWPWRWADVAYYPLAAVGVLMLFLANDTDRRLLRIESARTSAEQDWRLHPNQRPSVDLAPADAASLRQRYEWFLLERDIAESCRTLVDHECLAHLDHAEALEEVFRGADPRTTIGDSAEDRARSEERFCRLALAYVDKLPEHGTLTLNAFAKLKEALAAVARGKPAAEVAAALDADIAREQASFPLGDPKDRAFVAPYFNVHREYAVQLVQQLDWCVERDPAQANILRDLDRWRSVEEGRAQTAARFERDLAKVRAEQAKTPLQQLTHAVQLQFWPFVLTLALAIKFGKAMSGVSGDIRSLFGRLAGRVGRLRGRLPWRKRPVADAEDSDASM